MGETFRLQILDNTPSLFIGRQAVIFGIGNTQSNLAFLERPQHIQEQDRFIGIVFLFNLVFINKVIAVFFG